MLPLPLPQPTSVAQLHRSEGVGVWSMFSSKPPIAMCVDEEGGSEFPSCPYNWNCSKEEKEGRKDEAETKREGRGDGRGVKLHNAITMSSKLI